jgi:hypothetical protein
VERPEERTFDDMLVEDLEPTEEEQQAIIGGSKAAADAQAGQNSATPSSGVDAVA